jgi:hypothetical protein
MNSWNKEGSAWRPDERLSSVSGQQQVDARPPEGHEERMREWKEVFTLALKNNLNGNPCGVNLGLWGNSRKKRAPEDTPVPQARDRGVSRRCPALPAGSTRRAVIWISSSMLSGGAEAPP